MLEVIGVQWRLFRIHHKGRDMAKSKRTKSKLTRAAAKKSPVSPAMKRSRKKRAARDVVTTPTVEQIERSVSAGKSIALSEFVKGIKW
jgi:hypothetical protein